MVPSVDDIRVQLDRLVNSEAFATARSHRRLLQYLVERTLAGDSERLKEYVLATEVFGRPESYDSRLDSIVRVEARRLRARLEGYYRGAGAGDPVVISIPRGSYIPQFVVRPRPTSTSPEGPAHEFHGRSWRNRPSLRRIAQSATAAACLVAAMSLQPNGTSGRPSVPELAIAVLPFESYSSSAEHQLLAERITDDVTGALVALGSMSVASRASVRQQARESARIRELAHALRVQFVIEASAVVDDTRLRVVARLVDTTLDRKVWARIYEVNTAEVASLASRVAADAAEAALERFYVGREFQALQ
jgi:adenylate cyclase